MASLTIDEFFLKFCTSDVVITPSFHSPARIESGCITYSCNHGKNFSILILGKFSPLDSQKSRGWLLQRDFMKKKFQVSSSNHTQDGISQIWLQVRLESRKIEEWCYILATCWDLLSTYGDFRTISLKSGNFCSFFPQKSFVWVTLDCSCHHVAIFFQNIGRS